LFEKVKLPDDRVLIPGVIESKSNFIEHPELIAQRIARYAKIVGRQNVIAGSDCGFATFAGSDEVHESIVWAKFDALGKGARIASRALWAKRPGTRPAKAAAKRAKAPAKKPAKGRKTSTRTARKVAKRR
jgi:5-methyltetrahydropteroyltriglutamate--homocysteine methyltransferase